MRTKKRIAGLLPVKKWLSLDEACAYTDMSKTKFLQESIGLTVSTLGAKKYYKVSELDTLFEDHIIIKQTA